MIQIYTGDGKGKTTASLGLAIRAAGAGKKVYIAQFIKGKEGSELTVLKKIKNIKLEQFGRKCFIKGKPKREDIEAACAGLKKIKKIAKKGKYDVIILDEINVAMNLKLLDCQEVLKFLKNTPKKVELILTGRNAPREISRNADLISCIKEIKHYFKAGLQARKGIEY